MSPRYGVLTFRRVASWIVGLLLIVAASSAIVGFAAEGFEHFNWEVAAIFGTAMGTTVLAAFTGALAYTTSGDVRATWELARLTQAEQRARDRPVVVVEPGSFGFDEGNAGGVLLLRNVGLGPALAIDLSIDHLFDDDEPPSHIDASWGILAVDQGAQLPIVFPPDRRFNRQTTSIFHLRLTGTVTDRAGNTYEVTLSRALRAPRRNVT